MAPLLSLALLGCQRSGRLGRWIAICTVALWGYVMAATYVAKLFPLYGGFTAGRSTLRELWRWYFSDWPRASDILNTTAMVPANVLLILLAGFAIVLSVAVARVVKQL